MNIVLRSEYKETEKRTPLIPDHAKKLIEAGYHILVEKCDRRIYSNQSYKDVGCQLIDNKTWEQYTNKENHIILGLKELPTSFEKISGSHIYFAHIYKDQEHASDTFKQYQAGDGLLYDLEFLQDQTGRRVAAFGYWAGYVGAALTYWERCLNERNKTLRPLQSFETQDDLINAIKKSIPENFQKQSAIIIGASGRCGTGASDCLSQFGCELSKWDTQETKRGGPFEELGQHDLFINCVYLSREIPPFIDTTILNRDDFKLKVIGDVSCDPNGPWNPVRIYNKHTSWENPIHEVERKTRVIAIDNLPSLLPKESSEDFSNQLLPTLLDLRNDQSGTWKKAKGYFENYKNKYL